MTCRYSAESEGLPKTDYLPGDSRRWDRRGE